MVGKPFVISTLAIGTPDPVNLDRVVTFQKAADSNQRREKDGKFHIAFIRDENSVGPKTIVWRYNSEENRDCEYDVLVSRYAEKLEKTV